MFLRSLTEQAWLKKLHKRMLLVLHIFLALTFVATIIVDFTECHPFEYYWIVSGEEGHSCRQAYGHAIVMGVLNIITDLLLVAFPIPMLINSQLPLKRYEPLKQSMPFVCLLMIITGR